MRQQLDPRVVVALDFSTIERVRAFVSQLEPRFCRLKIGKILFTRYGAALVEELIQKGFSVFLDLKFHDIPQTVAGACRAAAELGVWMVNVHVSGGRAMLEAAANEIAKCAHQPLLTGVTVLTSLESRDLSILGIQDAVTTLVPRLAKLAEETGLDGVVCSAQEASLLRAQCADDFVLVTPGIRLLGGDQHDQKRVMTPDAALAAGADYLVMGRAITEAADPALLLQQLAEMEKVG